MSLNPNSKWPTQTTAPSADYPYGSAQNITTTGDGTGTPFVKDFVDDWWGLQQEILQRAGITPSGLPDHAGDSDVFNGIRRTCGYPGLIVPSCLITDPATLGIRCLKLDGTTVLIASYPDLVTATYVGDGNNGTAEAFIKTSDAAGTTPNVAGPYFKLPDARGRFPRGYDPTATLDPDGASRFRGDTQIDKLENHNHPVSDTTAAGAPPYWGRRQYTTIETGTGGTAGALLEVVGAGSTQLFVYDSTPSAPMDDGETRPDNFCVEWLIWY